MKINKMIKSSTGRLTEKKKLTYKKVGFFLKEHTEIKYRKRSDQSYEIDISTIPEHLAEHFLEIANLD